MKRKAMKGIWLKSIVMAKITVVAKITAVAIASANLEACSTAQPHRKALQSQASQPVSKSDVSKTESSENTSDAVGDPVSAADMYLTAEPKAVVAGAELDSLAMRLNGLRVGMQEYARSKSPVVAYFIPQKADYIQIVRCDHDALIRGALDNLNDVDLGSVSTADESRIFQMNDFWNAAMLNPSCKVLSAHVEDKEILDNAAPSGSYRYVARACVYADRLVQAENLVGRVCSRQVALSPVLADFINERAVAENDALAAQLKWKEKIETLGGAISAATLALNTALKTCDTLEADREARVKRKAALTTLLGSGVSVAAKLLNPANEGLTSVEKAKTVWQERADVKAEGQKVGQVLMWLLTSVKDFPKSCTVAEQLVANNHANVLELKAAHEQYAIAVDAALAASAHRIAVEK